MPQKLSEKVIQQAWAKVLFRQDGLVTQSGSRVDILKPGRINRLPGPDFKEANIIIDGMMMFGDIEIHHSSDDWERHNHHTDPAYNHVILHIALDDRIRPIVREDKTVIPHVNIASRLGNALYQKMGHSNQLPCTNAVNTHLDLAEKQLLKSADLYFDELVERHLIRLKTYSEYDQAWLMAVFAGFCSVLGSPGNREPMEAISSEIWALTDRFPHPNEIEKCMHRITGWNLSAGRPASRPKKRVVEAYFLAQILKKIKNHQIHKLSYSEIIDLIWPVKYKTSTTQVMIMSVLIPALWALYSLEGRMKEATEVRSFWKTLPAPLSPEAQKFMWPTPHFSAQKWNKSINWHYRSMCSNRRCKECTLGRLV